MAECEAYSNLKNFARSITPSTRPTIAPKGQASEWALLRRHSSEDLFGVQICGAYPDTIIRTAELIDYECTVDFIDINMGCPIDIVLNKGVGSSLLTKPMRIKNISQAASSMISKPITLKVRTSYFEGRNRIDTLISDISYWGVSALTIHGRSRQQRYSKLADWDYIYQCAKKAPDAMQILRNGDIFSYDDWSKHTSECPELSSCMIARGVLIKPWLFTEIKEQRHWDISSCERLNIFKDYVNFGLEHWGSDTKEVGGGLDYYGYYPRPEERMGHLPPRDVGHLPPRDTEYDRYYRNGVSGFEVPARPVSGGLTSIPGFIGGAPEKMLPPDASNTLFVEGLPPNCTRREVSHIFRPFVGFKEVRLVNKESKRAGGDPLVLCFVDFTSPGHAAVALDALQGYKFDEDEGNNLRLQFARFPGASRSGGGPRSKR